MNRTGIVLDGPDPFTSFTVSKLNQTLNNSPPLANMLQKRRTIENLLYSVALPSNIGSASPSSPFHLPIANGTWAVKHDAHVLCH